MSIPIEKKVFSQYTDGSVNCSLKRPLRQPYGLPPPPKGEASGCVAALGSPAGRAVTAMAVTERVIQTTIYRFFHKTVKGAVSTAPR